MSHYLGIDFGSHSNFITRWNNDKKHLEDVPIFSEYGAAIYTFPNVLYYEKSGNIVVGKTAYNSSLHNTDNIITDIKNNIGKGKKGVYIEHLKREVGWEEALEDLAAYIDTTMRKKSADADSEAVISIPYTYTKRQKDAVTDTMTKGGIKVISVISSPIAVVLGFELLESVKDKKNVVIFDIGETEYRIYLLKITRSGADDKYIIDIKGAEIGNRGGRDIDLLISDYISRCLAIEAKNYKDKAILMHIAANIKEHLSYFDEYDENPIICSRIFKNKLTSVQLSKMIKNSGLISDILDSAFELLDGADMTPEDIDDIIMSGGTSNVPVIKEEISSFFQKEISAPGEFDKDNKLLEGEGAAKYCGMLKEGKVNFSVINRSICDICVKCGEEDKAVLPKGSEYNKFSQTVFFRLSDENNNMLCIYSKNGLKRYVQFSRSGFIGVQLGNNNDGELMYRFTDVKERVISEGIVGGT